MNKALNILVSIAVIALLAIAAHYLIEAHKVSVEAPAGEISATPSATETEPSTIAPALEASEKTEIIEDTKNVQQKIDASTDKAMIDSLDYISRQLDSAGQQQLQDDYSVIASALTVAKDTDSLAKVREAMNGKTAAELSEIAAKLKPKN